jgi:hypothetical protein
MSPFPFFIAIAIAIAIAIPHPLPYPYPYPYPSASPSPYQHPHRYPYPHLTHCTADVLGNGWSGKERKEKKRSVKLHDFLRGKKTMARSSESDVPSFPPRLHSPNPEPHHHLGRESTAHHHLTYIFPFLWN